MLTAPLHPNETERLQALRNAHLLDTPEEQEYDDITTLASFICDTPIALVSLVDEDRQWFKSRVGLEAKQTPRDIAFCSHAILEDDIFEIQDASTDIRFADNPLVTGDLHLRFYAGVPLTTYDQHSIGTLCVIDSVPHALSEKQREGLRALGRQIMRIVELRQATEMQEELRNQLSSETALNRAIINNAGAAIISTDLNAVIKTFNPAAEKMLGYSADEMIDKHSPVALLHDPEEIARRGVELSQRFGEPIEGLEIFLRPLRDAPTDTSEWTYTCKDGKRLPITLTLSFLRDEASGETVGYLGIIRDISDRKELELQQRLLFESETLLKEIHHRVKNNMQVISSLLSIQAKQLKDPEQRDVFHSCRERIRAMSLIHDRLYTTGCYSGIDFGEYLREMTALISSSNRPDQTTVHINLTAEPLEVSIEQAVPLSLISSELVLNSLKHAFKGRSEGTLTVKLSSDGTTCHLFVGDDGPGMPTGSSDHSGVGMQLINGLSRQIKARLEQSDGPGMGTTITWKP
jgi:PAS domain S-box-containing protein